MQWAAVKTHRSLMMIPPQKWLLVDLRRIDACMQNTFTVTLMYNLINESVSNLHNSHIVSKMRTNYYVY
jgi:hypothetical protein